MPPIDQIFFNMSGLLGGVCLIVSIAYFRESADESISDRFFRFMSLIVGLILGVVVGPVILAAPFAISHWQYFPNMLPIEDRAHAFSSFQGLAAAGVICLGHWLMCRSKTHVRPAMKYQILR